MTQQITKPNQKKANIYKGKQAGDMHEFLASKQLFTTFLTISAPSPTPVDMHTYPSDISLLILVYLLTPCVMHTVQDKNFSVVIIGAGVAGISTAARLLENNINNFVILEAEDRIGGRIHSIQFGGVVADLGAEFIHGKENNIVYSLAKEYNIIEDSPHQYNFTYSDGKVIDEDLAKDINKFIEDLYELDVDNDISQGDLYRKRYKDLILDKYQNDQNKLKVATEALLTLEKCVCDYEGCSSWNDLPYKGLFEMAEGSQSLHWNGHGYKTIIDIITKSYPDPSQKLPVSNYVKFNKEVTRIQYNNSNNKTVVECEDGSRYIADYVVFTPSLGVLKEQYKTLFYPQLNGIREECIQKVAFGAILKIILHFTQRWWDAPLLNEAFVWKAEDIEAALKDFPEGKMQDDSNWLTGLYLITSVGRNSNVIMVWYIGEGVDELENLPRQSIKNGTMYVLNKFLGQQLNVTQPDKIEISHWKTNPHFRGTYCHSSMESHRTGYKCNEQLSKPLYNKDGKPVVLFAGEATSPHHYATVHGAIETGFREAGRIIEMLASQSVFSRRI